MDRVLTEGLLSKDIVVFLSIGVTYCVVYYLKYNSDDYHYEMSSWFDLRNAGHLLKAAMGEYLLKNFVKEQPQALAEVPSEVSLDEKERKKALENIINRELDLTRIYYKFENEKIVFLADTGDDFNTTKLLGDKILRSTPKLDEKFIIFGGDIVYPYPTYKLIKNKFWRPFFQNVELKKKGFLNFINWSPLSKYKIQKVEGEDHNRNENITFFAIPGNHDSHDNAKINNAFHLLAWEGSKYANDEGFDRPSIDLRGAKTLSSETIGGSFVIMMYSHNQNNENKEQDNSEKEKEEKQEKERKRVTLFFLLDGRVDGDIHSEQFNYFYNSLFWFKKMNYDFSVVLISHQPFWLVKGKRPLLRRLYRILIELRVLKLVLCGDLHFYSKHNFFGIDHIVVGTGGAFCHFPHLYEVTKSFQKFGKKIESDCKKSEIVFGYDEKRNKFYPSKEVSKSEFQKLTNILKAFKEAALFNSLWAPLWLYDFYCSYIHQDGLLVETLKKYAGHECDGYPLISSTLSNFPVTFNFLGKVTLIGLTLFLRFFYLNRFQPNSLKDLYSSLLRSKKYKGYLDLEYSEDTSTWKYTFTGTDNDISPQWRERDTGTFQV